MKGNPAYNWLIASLLALPMLAVFASYYFHGQGFLIPTGLFQYDNAGYLAYARQVQEHLPQISYSNPFNYTHTTPIYFQPQTVFFALLLSGGLPASAILIPFTLLCTICCFRIVIAIHDVLLPVAQHRLLNILLFCWGGGLLAIAGIFYHFIHPQSDLLNDAFFIDPEHGWWGLNLGRAMFFSCEAYYHLLFFATIYLLLRRKFVGALILMLLLSSSHPFTGIELATMVAGWALWEKFKHKTDFPTWFMPGACVICALHLWYYLFYLNSFAEHHSVQEQYSLPWRLTLYRMLPAYIFTGVLAIAAMLSKGFRAFFVNSNNRLFFTWFIVAFLLAHHDWFVAAKQPIHFTRGYIWSSLFLLGLPVLDQVKLFSGKRVLIGLLATLIFLSDNILWITDYLRSKPDGTSASYISLAQDRALNIIQQATDTSTILVSEDKDIAVLAAVRTSAYPWYSHPYTTPFAEERKNDQERFFSTGIMPKEWEGRKLLWVMDSELHPQIPLPLTGFARETVGKYIIIRNY